MAKNKWQLIVLMLKEITVIKILGILVRHGLGIISLVKLTTPFLLPGQIIFSIRIAGIQHYSLFLGCRSLIVSVAEVASDVQFVGWFSCLFYLQGAGSLRKLLHMVREASPPVF